MLSFQLIPTALAQVANQGQQVAETAQSAGADFAALLGKGLLGITIFAVAMVLAIIAKGKMQRFIEAKAGEQHKNLVILYSRIAFIVVAIAGALVGMLAAGIPIELFTGGLGLGIGFAIKGPIENFFAGMVLLTQDKFNVGDTVEVQGHSGKIIDVTSRATTIRGWDGEEITIPNATFINEGVVCRSRSGKRRHTVEMSVGYGSDLKAAAEIMLAVIRRHAEVEPTPEPSVLVTGLGDSAVNLSAKFWTVTNGVTWWKVKSDIIKEIIEAFGAANIDIPYPVQTLRVDSASSGLLATNSNLIDRLAAIEAAKPAPVFTEIPAEVAAATTPAIEPAPMQTQAAEPQPVFAANPEPAPVAAGVPPLTNQPEA